MGDHAHIQNTIVCRGSTLHDRCSLRDCQVIPMFGPLPRSALCIICSCCNILTIHPGITRSAPLLSVVNRHSYKFDMQALTKAKSCICLQVGAGYAVAEGAELRDEVLAKTPRVSVTS